jgi:hypothetical protein
VNADEAEPLIEIDEEMSDFEYRLPEKPSKKALQIAARCWCDNETVHCVMDEKLATAFAKRIHALLNDCRLYPSGESK